VALVTGAWCWWRGLPTQQTDTRLSRGTGVADLAASIATCRPDPTRTTRPRPSQSHEFALSLQTDPTYVSRSTSGSYLVVHVEQPDFVPGG